MFEQCNHGYVAMTCPQCRGRSVSTAFSPGVQAVSAPRADARPHYSGAPLATRRYLMQEWEHILEKAERQVMQTTARTGVQDGNVMRKPIEMED